MFKVSEELQQRLEGFNPNKLGRLSSNIEEGVEIIDTKEFRQSVFSLQSELGMGIDLLALPIQAQKDAMNKLYFAINEAFEVANQKAIESSKKKSSVIPDQISLSEEEKEEIMLTNQKKEADYQARKLEEIEIKKAAKAMGVNQSVAPQPVTQVSLVQIEQILNPKSNAEKLANEIEEYFLKDENSVANLFSNQEIRETLLTYVSWKRQIHPDNISLDLSNKDFVESLANELVQLLLNNIFTEEDFPKLINKYGEKTFRKQLSLRVNKLISELEGRTKLYSAKEDHLKQEPKDSHPFIKAFSSFFEALKKR